MTGMPGSELDPPSTLAWTRLRVEPRTKEGRGCSFPFRAGGECGRDRKLRPLCVDDGDGKGRVVIIVQSRPSRGKMTMISEPCCSGVGNLYTSPSDSRLSGESERSAKRAWTVDPHLHNTTRSLEQKGSNTNYIVTIC